MAWLERCTYRKNTFVLGAYSSQKERLRQYSGQWVSTMDPSTDSVAKFPEIKMSSMNILNNHSLTVKVLQKDSSDRYNPILQNEGVKISMNGKGRALVCFTWCDKDNWWLVNST